MKPFNLLARRFDEFFHMINLASPDIYSKTQIRCMFLSFLWQRFFHRTFMIDYIQYRFYERNRRGRRRFVEYNRRHKIMDRSNHPQTDKIFDDKAIFNQFFKDYLGRDWLDLRKVDIQTFERFFEIHQQIFIKPQIGSFGHGVQIHDFKDVPDMKHLYDKIRADDSIVEEVIRQHESLETFNASSLNSVRIVTLVDRAGVPHVMAAVLRTGRQGKIADNFHHHGIASQIDIATGIVSTRGVDREFQRYVLHPDSGIPICGYKLPHWEEILEFARQLALVVPQTRFVGWDIALNREGSPVCIEGNRGADLDVTQTTDLIGKYHMYDRLI